jgi:hypothetical protein
MLLVGHLVTLAEWADKTGRGRLRIRVPGVFGVIGWLVVAATIATGCGGGPSQRDREGELLRTVTVAAGFTRQSVGNGPGDGAHPQEFYFGPAFDDVRAVVTAPTFDLTSDTGPPSLSGAGTTSMLFGPKPGQQCFLSVVWYGPMAVLDPWLGLTEEQRLAIRGVSVSCYNG